MSHHELDKVPIDSQPKEHLPHRRTSPRTTTFDALKIIPQRESAIYKSVHYAYDVSGHEVQRLELCLNSGVTCLYCVRKPPNASIPQLTDSRGG